MKKTLALAVVGTTLTAVILAVSAGAGLGRGIPTPKPPETQTFKTTCYDVAWVEADPSGNFVFYCISDDNEQPVLSVATWQDGTGKYPVGHEQQTSAYQTVAMRTASIAPIVTEFVGFQEAHPWAELEVSGFHSKLPSADGRRVVEKVHFEVIQD